MSIIDFYKIMFLCKFLVAGVSCKSKKIKKCSLKSTIFIKFSIEK